MSCCSGGPFGRSIYGGIGSNALHRDHAKSWDWRPMECLTGKMLYACRIISCTTSLRWSWWGRQYSSDDSNLMAWIHANGRQHCARCKLESQCSRQPLDQLFTARGVGSDTCSNRPTSSLRSCALPPQNYHRSGYIEIASVATHRSKYRSKSVLIASWDRSAILEDKLKMIEQPFYRDWWPVKMLIGVP